MAGLLASALAGCAADVSFDSPDSAARLRAIQRAASQDDRASIPDLVRMLDSDDVAVRLLAIRTLEEMTGQTLGYDYAAPSFERTPAVERWQAWVRDQSGESGQGKSDPGIGSSRRNDARSDGQPLACRSKAADFGESSFHALQIWATRANAQEAAGAVA